MSDTNDPKNPKPPTTPATGAPPPENIGPDLTEVQNIPDAEDPMLSLGGAGDMSLDALLAREAAKNAPPPMDPRKKKQIVYGGIAIVLLIVLLSIYGCQPRQGSMAFGICSTFLELNTPYPHTLRYQDLEGSSKAVRIYFTDVDPFGEFKQEMIECTFGPDEKMGMKLVEVKRNRRSVDPAIVKEFNLTLPTIMASDPYRIMPPDWKNPLVPDNEQDNQESFQWEGFAPPPKAVDKSGFPQY